MAKRKKSILSKTILRLIFGIPAILSLLTTLSSLIKYEIRIAGRSLVCVLMLALFCALLLMSSWLCVLGLLFVYLMSLQWSLYGILLALLGINCFMFLIILLIIRRYKAKLSFPETHRLLNEVCHIYKEI